jgi:hypothetical protein
VKKDETEFETAERNADEVLERSFARFHSFDDQLRRIEECLACSITVDHIPGAVGDVIQYLSWLERVESLGFEDISDAIKKGRFRERFTQPTSEEQKENKLPLEYMESLKGYIKRKQAELKARKEVLVEWIPQAEERAHRRRVDRVTLEYGRGSIKLIRTNIKISLWIPIGIFILTLLASLVIEAIRPELVDWIRQHIFGLKSFHVP